MLYIVYVVIFLDQKLVSKQVMRRLQKNGFSNWKKLERLEEHIRGPNSTHNKAKSYCEDVME